VGRVPSEVLDELVSESSAVGAGVEGCRACPGGVGCSIVTFAGITMGVAIDDMEGALWVRDADALRGMRGRGAPAEFEFRENGWSMVGDIM
jgi:hypothetical protein